MNIHISQLLQAPSILRLATDSARLELLWSFQRRLKIVYIPVPTHSKQTQSAATTMLDVEMLLLDIANAPLCLTSWPAANSSQHLSWPAQQAFKLRTVIKCQPAASKWLYPIAMLALMGQEKCAITT